jgi:hypothetical protein
VGCASWQTPAGADRSPHAFSIEPGETATTVSFRLQEEGLITDAEVFRLYMRYHGIDQRLAAGRFSLASNMSMPQIAEKLQQPQVEEIVVTVPEGCEEVAPAHLRIMTAGISVDGLRGARHHALGEYSFVPDGLARPRISFLTCIDYLRATPADLIGGCTWVESTRGLAPATAAGRGLSQVVTMASIVEREARLADERPIIASVYWNRVSGACSAETGGAYLQADPTAVCGRQAGRMVVEATVGRGIPADSIALQYVYPTRASAGSDCQPGFIGDTGGGGARADVILFLSCHGRRLTCFCTHSGRAPGKHRPLPTVMVRLTS